MTSLLRVSGLDCGILRDVSLDVDAGEHVCLTGASGSGKTRLLRAIADLDPNSGTVELDGRDRRELSGPEWRRQVVYVPAESRWWAETVAAHFPGGALDADDLAPLGIDPGTLSRPTAQLSSGERQRFALLRALALEPAVVLLDEPTASLDEKNTERVEQWLAERCRRGLAVLFVSHQPQQVERIADRRWNIVGARVEAGKCR